MPGETGAVPDSKFDTIWSMLITLEPTVKKRKEIWLVQDETENRTSSIVNLLERDEQEDTNDESGYDAKAINDILNLVAWAGGLWFFMTHMIIGPLIKWKVHNKLPDRIRNLGNDLFYGGAPAHNLQRISKKDQKVTDFMKIEVVELAESNH